MPSTDKLHVWINSAAPWLNEHVKGFIQKHVSDAVFIDDFGLFPASPRQAFMMCDGWELNAHFAVLNTAENGLLNAYPNSDAVARKDHLARVVEYWVAKRPESVLKNHVPITIRLNLDYSEYVDESLMAADDLTLLYTLEENDDKYPSERQWWILKPALVDGGTGIRLFSTVEELAGHLELAEYEDEDEDESSESADDERSAAEKEKENEANGFSPSLSTPGLDTLDALVTTTAQIKLDGTVRTTRAKKPQYVFKANGRIPSAQMRAFVAQKYVTQVPTIEGRKWHVRAYVLSIGRLKVHVFKEMLALLAAEDYEPPWKNPSLKSSLTNTALQDEEDFIGKESMRDFWAIDDDVLPGGGADWKKDVFRQICDVSAEVFRAAAYTMADKFTTMNKCFELFAVDFLIDTSGNAWLLEVNETPAFYEVGVARPLSLRLMETVICITMEHMGKADAGDAKNEEIKSRMVEVLDESDKLAKSNITEILMEG